MSITSDVELARLANKTQTKVDEPKAQAKESHETEEVVNEKSAAEGTTLAEIGDESDPSIAEENHPEDDEKKETRSKKKGGVEKRIEKLVKARTKARQDADFWRQEALKRQAETKVDKPKETLKIADGKPKPDQFESHEDYLDARDAWNRSQWKAEETERDLRTQAQKQIDSYVAKKNEFAKSHDDFDEVVESVNDIPMSLTVRELLLEDGGKPELAYELAKDPENYKRICGLSVIAAAREIGKIEAKLDSQNSSDKPEPKKITKAPKPIAPVGTKAKSEKSIYDPGLSQREFEKLREAELKQKRN